MRLLTPIEENVCLGAGLLFSMGLVPLAYGQTSDRAPLMLGYDDGGPAVWVSVRGQVKRLNTESPEEARSLFEILKTIRASPTRAGFALA